MNFLLVFLGGGIGSLSRYSLGILFKEHSHYCTFFINILSCFIIGVLFGLMLYKSHNFKNISPLLIAGFCGGFSTFSAYSLDVINMLRVGDYFHAFLYMLLTVVFCLLATGAGLLLIKSV